MPLVKLIVILMLVAIVVSLGPALYQLARDTGDSKQMLRALRTDRVLDEDIERRNR